MGRIAYDITDENRRRLELLKAFSTISNNNVTIADMVNAAIEDYYTRAYETYASGDAYVGLLDVLEHNLPKHRSSTILVRLLGC